jgi:hypothetical protein
MRRWLLRVAQAALSVTLALTATSCTTSEEASQQAESQRAQEAKRVKEAASAERERLEQWARDFDTSRLRQRLAETTEGLDRPQAADSILAELRDGNEDLAYELEQKAAGLNQMCLGVADVPGLEGWPPPPGRAREKWLAEAFPHLVRGCAWLRAGAELLPTAVKQRGRTLLVVAAFYIERGANEILTGLSKTEEVTESTRGSIHLDELTG